MSLDSLFKKHQKCDKMCLRWLEVSRFIDSKLYPFILTTPVTAYTVELGMVGVILADIRPEMGYAVQGAVHQRANIK